MKIPANITNTNFYWRDHVKRLNSAMISVVLAAFFCAPSANSQSFVSTGSMNIARAGHQATLLTNGTVLVTGGDTPGGTTNTAEIYDPATGTWRYALHAMNIARRGHQATLLPNGKVLIAAGADGSSSLNSAEIFDPATETFTLTGSMANVRHGSRGVLLNDGRVLAVSGRSTVTLYVTPTNEIYDPASGTWGAAPSLAAGVVLHTATLLPSGQVLIAGGYDGYTPTAYNFVYLYTPSTNTLVSMSPLLIHRLDHGAALLPDGKVLIVAGTDPSFVVDSTEVYDPTVPPNGQSVAGSSLSQARRDFTTTTLGNGDGLAAGGFQSGDGCCFVATLATAELRDHNTGMWTPAGTMSTPRSAHTATLLPGGRVLVVGGTLNPGQLNSAELWVRGPITSNVMAASNPVAIGNGVTLTATVDDSTTGGSTIASAQYNINGGAFQPMAATDGSFDEVAENVTASVPPFTVTGVYTICVEGVDAPGNVGPAACIPLPVYDPTGGFATGGGSIGSPAGADLANPSAAGPATFGFVSKYLPGANTPSGSLVFQFHAGNLDFKSTSMDWLVVTGEPRAQFHGAGTVNGSLTCQFQVDAWDNSFQPGNLDAFGIKIYSCGNGQDRYSIPATPLAQGSIIIHQ